MLSLLFCMSYRKSPPALILHVLASFVNSKTIHKLLRIRKDTNRRTSSMATARTETTRGPTYSMTRAIWALPHGKKVSSVDAIVCVATIATHSRSRSSHGPTSPIMATSMSLSARVQPQCRHILQSTWCARPVCMQQPYRPGMTCLKETLRRGRTTMTRSVQKIDDRM